MGLKKNNGISLIVLIITIIIMIILATAIILSLSKNNIIGNAKDATLKSDIANLKNELAMFEQDQIIVSNSFDIATLNATKDSLNYNTKTDSGGNITSVLKSLDNKNKDNIIIIDGKIYYKADTLEQAKRLEELGIDTYMGKQVFVVNSGVLGLAPGIAKEDLVGLVIVPDGTTEIPSGLINDCINLREINLPNTLKKINEYAFAGCISLKEIVIPSSVSWVGQVTFGGCVNLKKAKFESGSDSEVKLDRAIFGGCDKLEVLELNNSIKNIPESMCPQITTLKEVVIGNNIESIGNGAFSGCSALRSISLINGTGTSTSYIGESAFFGCSALKDITIKNINTIKRAAFHSRPDAGGHIILENVDIVGESTFFENGISEVTLKDVKEISRSAFFNCANLEKVNTSEGLEKIDESVFFDCTKLKTIVIPSSIKNIGRNPFFGCSSMESIKFRLPNLNSVTVEEPFNSVDGTKYIDLIYSYTGL